MINITSEDLWHFSKSLYQHKAVETLLLSLQQEIDMNVNLALLCAMLNKHQMYLSTTQINTLVNNVGDFNFSYTKKLRELRAHFKTNRALLNQYDEIRETLLKTELLLEQQEQQMLVSTLQQFDNLNATHSNNLDLYQHHLTSTNTSAIKTLLKLSDLNQYIK